MPLLETSNKTSTKDHLAEQSLQNANLGDIESIPSIADILTLKINSPNTPFSSDQKTVEVQVSPQEIVQELHLILQTEYNETCHRTCFSLHFNGERLDNYAEIGNIDGLENGSILIVVEEPYTLKEAKNHIKHLRHLIRNLDIYDALHGYELQSFS